MEAHTRVDDNIKAVAKALLHQERLPKGQRRLMEVWSALEGAAKPRGSRLG